jgi:factor associated with neutral sphingomyelinase activation
VGGGFRLDVKGIEVFYGESNNLLLVLATTLDRDHLYDQIVSQQDVRLQDTGQEHMTLKWQNGVISNYEYLMYLNRLKGLLPCKPIDHICLSQHV